MKNQKRGPKVKPYRGVVVPMITPFTADGDLDELAIRRVIDHLVGGGVAGIFVLGTTGEEASMPMGMRSRLLKLTIEHVTDRATVYAGISHNSLSCSVEAAWEYHELGADVLVARLPTYYALNSAEQYDYFCALLDRIPGPFMLYNITSTTHMTIPVETVERLRENPKVVGIKDSDNNLSRLEELVARLGGRSDFSILVGVTRLSSRSMLMGADGIVPSLGNLAPELCQRLYEGAVAGDIQTAEALQARLDQLEALIRGNRSLAQSLGFLKAAMGALSLCEPYVLSPLPTPGAVEVAAIHESFLEWSSEPR
ncbi:MAG: dihydrodipicolinate synthase family protein [Anaerolineae bacterium]